MPEGDAIHRIANTFSVLFQGSEVETSSPQGRFTASAQLINHHKVVAVRAVGKHMFVGFSQLKLPPLVLKKQRLRRLSLPLT